jgi:hypothetical protein
MEFAGAPPVFRKVRERSVADPFTGVPGIDVLPTISSTAGVDPVPVMGRVTESAANPLLKLKTKLPE